MYAFSKSVTGLRSSEIRDLMSTLARPGMISFAGGMPNDNMFPIAEVDEIYNNLPAKIKQTAFQYGPTPGYPPLLETVKDYLGKKGLPVENNKLLITTGSLQAINILTKEFIDPGDTILLENPSFIGSISVFKSYQANLESIPLQSDGLDIEILRDKILKLNPKPKFLYIIPNFHNPAGTLYSNEKRQSIMEISEEFDLIVIEDDAYHELYFDDEAEIIRKPLKADNRFESRICYTGTFSKIMGPGFRLGWLLVNDEIYKKCELIKQAMDACSPNFTQVLANEFISKNYLDPYISKIRPEYKSRMEITDAALTANMPEFVTWTKPRGGFYFWLQMPQNYDASAILNESITKGAVFVSGKTFDPLQLRNDNIRISFSNMEKSDIDKGIKIIADCIINHKPI